MLTSHPMHVSGLGLGVALASPADAFTPAEASLRGASFGTAPSSAIPIDNLSAGPEQGILRSSHVLDYLTKILQPVGCPHNIGVYNKRHHASRFPGVMAQLFELIDRPLLVFRGLVVLNQHHCHVVAFLGIRHAHNRPRAGVK